jgi:hypothetical protein
MKNLFVYLQVQCKSHRGLCSRQSFRAPAFSTSVAIFRVWSPIHWSDKNGETHVRVSYAPRSGRHHFLSVCTSSLDPIVTAEGLKTLVIPGEREKMEIDDSPSHTWNGSAFGLLCKLHSCHLHHSVHKHNEQILRYLRREA